MIEEMLVAVVLAFKDTPTSSSRFVPVPVVWLQLMVVPVLAEPLLNARVTGFMPTAPMAQEPLAKRPAHRGRGCAGSLGAGSAVDGRSIPSIPLLGLGAVDRQSRAGGNRVEHQVAGNGDRGHGRGGPVFPVAPTNVPRGVV